MAQRGGPRGLASGAATSLWTLSQAGVEMVSKDGNIPLTEREDLIKQSPGRRQRGRESYSRLGKHPSLRSGSRMSEETGDSVGAVSSRIPRHVTDTSRRHGKVVLESIWSPFGVILEPKLRDMRRKGP